MGSESHERYARQMILAEIGEDGQSLLKESRALILGAGGLSAPVALYLAAAGVGTIGIVDGDKVSLSNLQRQILFDSLDLDLPKVKQAKSRLTRLNSDVKVITYDCFISKDNALEIAENYDIIIDGSDNFETKFLANDLACKLQIPLVYASILRWQGEVSVFDSSSGPCYRCLYPEKPRGHVPNCAEAGVIGALAGIMGSVQALETIKTLLFKKSFGFHRQETLIGRVYRLDARSFQSRTLHLDKDTDCSVCSKQPREIELPSYDLSEVCDLYQREVFPEDLSPYDLIDVREPHEWESGHLPKAKHWPLSRMNNGDFPVQDSGKTYLIYCQGGVRSKRAIRLLESAGWDLSTVRDLRGGFVAWADRAKRDK